MTAAETRQGSRLGPIVGAGGDRENNSLPLAAGVLLIIGVLGFAARFDILQKLLPSAQVVWALIFLLGGGWLVWRYVLRSKGE